MAQVNFKMLNTPWHDIDDPTLKDRFSRVQRIHLSHDYDSERVPSSAGKQKCSSASKREEATLGEVGRVLLSGLIRKASAQASTPG